MIKGIGAYRLTWQGWTLVATAAALLAFSAGYLAGQDTKRGK